MNLFWDTSVLVKLYHREQGTDNLWGFLIRYSADLFLTISDLTPIEFRSAFLKRVRIKEIELDTAMQVFTDFERDIELMNIVEIDRSIKDRAIELLDKHASTKNFRTLDSLQLSSAVISNESFAIDFFIAADQGLSDVAEPYFQVYNPAKVVKGSLKS
jgi:predicted nucleic acid-binding protein